MRFLRRARIQLPNDPCACGHTRDEHSHYRPGSDCGACGEEVCAAFVTGPQFQVIVDSRPEDHSRTA